MESGSVMHGCVLRAPSPAAAGPLTVPPNPTTANAREHDFSAGTTETLFSL